MIIVQLTGGLGNQLFQYAMGRALAIKNNCELKLDLSFFENYDWHEYSLDSFQTINNIATKDEIEKIKKLNNSFFKKLERKIFRTKSCLVVEESLLFNPDYLKLKNPVYLIGYWQCEEYFKKYKEQIKQDLQIIILPSKENSNFLERINSSESVSLHIRRGNFITVDYVNQVHGTCSMEYYLEAVKFIANKCSEPVFYIFSDDISWAKKNFVLPFEIEFVDINDEKTDYEDLRLMYNCKHHIIANSTFSWWGAWLKDMPDKIVVAPKKWFAQKDKNMAAGTIIPKNWITI